MTKFIHHAPSRVTVHYGSDWTPLVIVAVIAGACVYFATLIASILAAALVATVVVAAGSVAVLVLVLRRNGLRTVRRYAAPAERTLTARVVPPVGAPKRQAIAAPANHLHIHLHGDDAVPEAVLRAITDAVPQPRSPQS